jgi:adenosylcobinamide-GDP ribazoletransferase
MTPEPPAFARPLLDALRFLTVLPLPGLATTSSSDFAAAVRWFPVAGLLIGGLLVLAGWPAGLAWDGLVRAACVVVAWGIITGGMHLDGLSDTFDAVMSWRPRERKLEIMKDSRVGAMGLLAVVGVLLLKFAWLQSSGAGWWQAVLLAPVWGRWAQVYALCHFPAARAGGLGEAFQARLGRADFWYATAAALLVSLLVAPWHALVVGGLVWAGSWALARWWLRDLGGLTGDTYGALCELGEVVVLAVLAF